MMYGKIDMDDDYGEVEEIGNSVDKIMSNPKAFEAYYGGRGSKPFFTEENGNEYIPSRPA